MLAELRELFTLACSLCPAEFYSKMHVSTACFTANEFGDVLECFHFTWCRFLYYFTRSYPRLNLFYWLSVYITGCQGNSYDHFLIEFMLSFPIHTPSNGLSDLSITLKLSLLLMFWLLYTHPLGRHLS